MTEISPIDFTTQNFMQQVNAKNNKKVEGLFNFSEKELTPQEKKENEKIAINKLKEEGYKITQNNDGTYLLEDLLGHKSKITSLGLNEKGGVTFSELQVQIIDPSQRERYERNVLNGGKDSVEEKAKYAKQAMDKAKKAGYEIEDKGNGQYVLTNPEGGKSLVTNFDISYDGGATWTTLPVYIEGENQKPIFEEY